MKNFISITVIIIFFITSCKTNLETVKPSETYTPQAIESEPSTIQAQVNIDVATLEKSINSAFTDIVYEDNSYANDNMLIKISKIKDLGFSITSNRINSTLPLKIWVKYELKKEVLGVVIKDYYEAEGSITIVLQSQFSIDKNWNLKTVTSIKSFNWVKSPTLSVAGISIPVSAIANIAISFIKKDMCNLIDQTIAESFQLQPTMQSMWKSMYRPMEIDKDYQMWFRMMPIMLYSSPIIGSGKSLSFTVGIKTLIETTMGEELQELPKKAQIKLPDYIEKTDIQPDFTMHSKVLVTYSKLSEIAKKFVVGKEFTNGRKKIIIDSVNVYGHENSLIVAIAVKGSVNGLIYCTGNLSYNDSLKAIKITNFDFDVTTKNALVKSAGWLLHKNFLKMIEPMLTISVKKELEDAVKEGNTYLNNYKLYNGITLQGKLQKIQVNHVFLNQKGIVVDGTIGGKLSIVISDIL